METPKISIIVPIYNTEAFLEECVDSIINQTYKDIEVILVENGSTDKSPLICDEYAKKDSRVRVIHKVHGSISSARNAGLEAASGEYIAFVDSDDAMLPDALEILVGICEDEQADISICKAARYYIDKTEENEDSEEKRVMDSEKAIYQWLCRNTFGSEVWGKLYRRSVVENIRFPEKRCEDICYLFDAVCAAQKTVFVKKYKYLYRMHRLYENRTEYRRPVEDEKPEVLENICITVAKKYPDLYNNLFAACCESVLSSIMRIYGADKQKAQKVYLNNSAAFFDRRYDEIKKSDKISKRSKFLIMLFYRCRTVFGISFKIRNILKG